MEKSQANGCGVNVLSIVWYKVLPAKYGGQQGIHSFNSALAEHCKLTCLCSNDNIAAPGMLYRVLPILPRGKWQFINGRGAKTVRQTIRKLQPDWIIIEHPYYFKAAYRMAQEQGAKLAVHAHNIENQRFKELGKWWWSWVRRMEKRAFRKADLIFFKTKADMEWACTHFTVDAGKCQIVPYPLTKPPAKDTTPIRDRYVKNPDQRLLLFAGSLDYAPNAAAVRAIYREIAPRLPENMRVLICGQCSDKHLKKLLNGKSAGVLWVGEVEDIESYYAAADIFINPVVKGGGVQTKILHALAANRSVVCFENMLEGCVAGESGGQLFVARQNDWDDFFRQIGNALREQKDTSSLFFEYHSPERIAANVVELFNKHKK